MKPSGSSAAACLPLGEASPHQQESSNGAHAATLGLSLQALALIARLHQVAAEPDLLAHQLGKSVGAVGTTDDLLLAAKLLGLRAKRSRTNARRLAQTPLPALALMADGSVAVLARADPQRVLLQRFTRDSEARPLIEPLETFTQAWSGELILIASQASLAGELAQFDFSWFMPSLVRHRKLIGEVLLVSLCLQFFALVSPLFFQVVMDKVLVHRGLRIC